MPAATDHPLATDHNAVPHVRRVSVAAMLAVLAFAVSGCAAGRGSSESAATTSGPALAAPRAPSATKKPAGSIPGGSTPASAPPGTAARGSAACAAAQAYTVAVSGIAMSSKGDKQSIVPAAERAAAKLKAANPILTNAVDQHLALVKKGVSAPLAGADLVLYRRLTSDLQLWDDRNCQ
ncbi:MAG: hypothetical protein HYX32_02535 [Actinobacteria bacterium]|nr:hypothetical protein [Actinomycetota bacterium]